MCVCARLPVCPSVCLQFFVASDPNVKTDRLWHDKYSLRKSMIPSFFTMDQARKVRPTRAHAHTCINHNQMLPPGCCC